MNWIFSELAQYNLKKINIGQIQYDSIRITIPNKYYIVTKMVYGQMEQIILFCRTPFPTIQCYDLNKYGTDIYEIEYEFNEKNLFEIFYNFCKNIYKNNQFELAQNKLRRINFQIGTIYSTGGNNIECVIGNNFSYEFYISANKFTVENENELENIQNLMEKHIYSTIINVKFY